MLVGQFTQPASIIEIARGKATIFFGSGAPRQHQISEKLASVVRLRIYVIMKKYHPHRDLYFQTVNTINTIRSIFSL